MTTGTCAALAAKAAVEFLIGKAAPETVRILTPKGEEITARVEQAALRKEEDGGLRASCAVRKDAGDDYDVTDGLLIFAEAGFLVEAEGESGSRALGKSGACVSGEPVGKSGSHVLIGGGEGVGRVTKPGLDQPVGEAAINGTPRQMIRDAVLSELQKAGLRRDVQIIISVPGGGAAAKKTFNPTLGITGGISILGTSGIVEPMSDEALVETIRAELSVMAAQGKRYVAAVPGNMGAERLRACTAARDGEAAAEAMARHTVTCSNFIGKTVDLAGELGFLGLLFFGHTGKLVKLGNGLMNTHSYEGDARLDTLVSCALSAGGDLPLLKRIQQANTTVEAAEILKTAGIFSGTMAVLCGRIDGHLRRRAMDGLATGAMLFTDGANEPPEETEDADRIYRAILSEEGLK